MVAMIAAIVGFVSLFGELGLGAALVQRADLREEHKSSVFWINGITGLGLAAVVAVGAFAHLGVTLGLLPTTGVNLPFISAGGTGLVLALGCTGVLLNIAARRRC